MLFNNLKEDTDCLEQLSMINANRIVIKLRNKPWVDPEIEEQLENRDKYFEQNYQEFSSFEKW